MKAQHETERMMFALQEAPSKGLLARLLARGEIIVPILGLPLFFMMVGSNEGHLTTGQVGLVVGLGAIYIALVVWSPMSLPSKQPQPFIRAELRRAASINTTWSLR